MKINKKIDQEIEKEFKLLEELDWEEYNREKILNDYFEAKFSQ